MLNRTAHDRTLLNSKERKLGQTHSERKTIINNRKKDYTKKNTEDNRQNQEQGA